MYIKFPNIFYCFVYFKNKNRKQDLIMCTDSFFFFNLYASIELRKPLCIIYVTENKTKGVITSSQ